MKAGISDKKKIIYILLAGILVRLFYVAFMPVVDLAQYDIGTVDLEGNVLTGHLGYIFYLVKNHAVCDFDPRLVYQFNHPPVHHILCALWVSFIGLFTDNVNTLIESVQYVTFVYSVITLMAFERILEELKAGIKGKAAALIIIAFQPTLIMTAGSVNNDGIGLMFQVLALWFSLRWYRTRSYKDIFGIALTVGLGMLSKLSAGLVAVPIGALMIYVLIKEWKESKAFPVKRLLQYIAFGAVVAPIGLFWVLRCFIKFGMPFTYIAYLPDTSPQYVGMYSTMERMFLPNPITLISNLTHGSLGMGWNIWVQMFRTSALGECDLSSFPMWGKLLCFAMMGLNLLVAVWAFCRFVLYISGQRKSGVGSDASLRILWLLTWGVMMYSYFSFAYTYPHECSMNFRYVQLAMFPPAIALAITDNGKAERLKIVFLAVYGLCAVGIEVLWCLAA